MGDVWGLPFQAHWSYPTPPQVCTSRQLYTRCFFCKNKFEIILNIKNNAPIPTAQQVRSLSFSLKQTNKPTTTMSTINNTNYSPSEHNVYLWCIMCCKDIVRDSDDHDHCMLVNKGYDLICQDCPWECKAKCGGCVICEDPSESESKDEPEDSPTVTATADTDQQKPSRFSKTAPDDESVWCHECAECGGWFAPCEHDMDCYSDHMSNPDVKCDCKCPNGCHNEDSDEEDTSDDVTDADREEARWEALWEEE